ncbi:tetratricopeptide repeat protein [Flagellimonas myxillae]|uniref:tetratricopeptide repeat protein n=1 Tax=Flagellimonas myxillae TaxID=2942214 RepID=UPI00201FABB1|nr:tetratricopeptide repeat protein [Muricauda myxillae]MCL6265865.1 tetratricopeptide repeat protein [Muricauda myxillae]
MKNRISLLFSVLTFPILVFSQLQGQDRIDSLLTALQQSPRDSSRTPILVNLWRAHINNDVSRAIGYSDSLIALGSDLENVAILATGYQRKGIAYYYFDDMEKSNQYYRKTLELSEAAGETATSAGMQLNIASNFSRLGQHDSAFYYNENARANFELVKDTSGIGSTYQRAANTRSSQGYYKLALENAITAAKIFEHLGDSLLLSDTNSAIARCYLKMGDTLSAIDYFENAKELYEKLNDKHYHSSTLIDLAAINIQNPNNHQKAEKQLIKSIELAKEVNSPNYLFFSYLNKGILHLKAKQYDNANEYLNLAQKVSDSTLNSREKAWVLYWKAELFSVNGQLDKSINAINRSLDLKQGTTDLELEQKSFQLLSKVFETKNEPEEALKWHKKYKRINDSVFNVENGQKLSELKIIYETEKREAEIALQEEEIKTLNEKAKVDRLTKGLYAGGLASALTLSGLMVFGFRQRIKKNRIAREKQEEIYRKEIEHKQKELASQTLHLVQKNTFIQELKENLESLKNSPEKFKVEFRRIVMLLKKQNASDKDWEVFKSYFSEVHNDFDQKLKTLYPDISEKEIRLAAFLRMNLTTKEIAATLNVLPDSILKSKYRLKKKLLLDKEIDLNQFLNAL